MKNSNQNKNWVKLKGSDRFWAANSIDFQSKFCQFRSIFADLKKDHLLLWQQPNSRKKLISTGMN